MKQHLFIYGTLGPGRPNEHIMTDIGGTWQAATVCGVLQEEGWGAEMGYPGIILDNLASEVKGFVFTSKNFDEHWQNLDEFEGDGYQRVLTQATLEDGRLFDVYVYALSPQG